MNDEGIYGYGQLAALLRARYCDPQIRGINKSDGLTWKVKEILERARALRRQAINNFANSMSTLTSDIPDRNSGNLAVVNTPVGSATGERKGLTQKGNRRRPSDLVSRLRRFLRARAVFQAD